jgi:uncharacterized protein YdaU (DUF1376 family)
MVGNLSTQCTVFPQRKSWTEVLYCHRVHIADAGMSRGRLALIQQVSHSSPTRPRGSDLNFYRRFPGDYARDTKHLTLAEHGAYTLLLDYYYATEKPIPSLKIAAAICNARTGGEVRVVKKVLAYFFKQRGKGWVNNRAEVELSHANDKRKAAQNSAKQRWHKSDGNANASKTQYENDAMSHRVRNAPRLQTPDSQKTPLSNQPSQDHSIVESSSSDGKLDDLKKSFLSKCRDPDGIIAATVEIVCARAEKSGVRIQSEAYIAKAVESFDFTVGQDKEELQQILRRKPL